MSGQPRLLVFVGKTLLFVLAFAAVWPFAAPAYARLLAGVTNWALPAHVSLVAEKSNIVVRSIGVGSASLTSLPFQAGLIMLLALMLATPGLKIKQRLVHIILGSIITFALHVVAMIVIALNVRATLPLIVLFASVGVDLFPILIWMALSARYWLPSLRPAARSI